MTDQDLLERALEEAEAGLREGGVPIGAALMDRRTGELVAGGHNLRVQAGDPTAHAEIVCIRNAGRRRDWRHMTLASTLSPCIMCTGAILLHRIGRVVIGENTTFAGAENLLLRHGVEVVVMDDVRCVELMRRFVAERPDLFGEDIGD